MGELCRIIRHLQWRRASDTKLKADAPHCKQATRVAARRSITELSKPVGVGGCVSAIDSGRTIWITDAHRGYGKRFVVHADEKLMAFLELEAAISACGELTRQFRVILLKLRVL